MGTKMQMRWRWPEADLGLPKPLMPTSCTRKSSCMHCWGRLRSCSMVSYMPWQERSFSTEPSVCRSNTRATRKMIFTPAEWRKDSTPHGTCLVSQHVPYRRDSQVPSQSTINLTYEEIEVPRWEMSCHGFQIPGRESRLCTGGRAKTRPQFPTPRTNKHLLSVDHHLAGTMKTPTNVPSQKNISQTRSTEAQGRVRAKMHMNHSVM